MPEWMSYIAQNVGVGVTLAVCFAVPKVWVNSILNRRDIDRQEKKNSGIFERLDKISNDVAYLRGQQDG